MLRGVRPFLSDKYILLVELLLVDLADGLLELFQSVVLGAVLSQLVIQSGHPPVYTGTSAPEIVATLKAYGITRCYYGHLHGNAIRYAVQGDVDGIRYKLVSADGLRFCPYRIN